MVQDFTTVVPKHSLDPDVDCPWLLREGHYIKTESGYMERIGTGKRIYCTYTCTITKNQPAEKKIKFIDTNACPHMLEINNTCPIVEDARVLEGYYMAHIYKKEI